MLNSGEGARLVGDRMEEAAGELHVPHIFEIEVVSALRRHAAHSLSPGRSAKLIKDLTSMSLTRYPHTALLRRIWEMRDNITAYDAAYVALAESLDAPLVTMDGRLARAAEAYTTVELFQ